MAAPVLQTEGAQPGNATTTSLTVTLPTSLENDILILCLVIWAPNTAAAVDDIPTPSGWTRIVALGNGTGDGQVAWFWRRVGASAPLNPVCLRGANWDTGADTAYGGRAWLIRGCETSGNPWDKADIFTTGGPFSAANQSFTSVLVSGSERTVIHFYGSMDNNTIGAAPAGWTAGTATTDAGGTDTGFQTYRKDNVSATTSAAAPTIGATAQGHYAYLGVSFKPPAPAGPIDVNLAELTETDSLLASSASKSLTLTELAELDASLSPAGAKPLTLAELAELDAMIALQAPINRTLAQLAEADSLSALAASKAATLAELVELAALLAPAASKSAAIAELAELDALLTLAATKTRTLSELAELDSLLPVGGGAAGPINVNLAELVEADSILSASAAKSVTLAELTGTNALLTIAAAKSVTLAELAGTNALLTIAGSKAATLAELAEADTLRPITVAQAKSVTVGQLAELDTLRPITVAQAKSVTVGLLAELDVLLSIATTGRAYHPRAGRVSVSSSATSASTSRGDRTAATGHGATDADVTPTGSDATVSDGLTTADVS